MSVSNPTHVFMHLLTLHNRHLDTEPGNGHRRKLHANIDMQSFTCEREFLRADMDMFAFTYLCI